MEHETDEPVVERFRPTSGRLSGILGLAGAAVIFVLSVVAWSAGTPLGVAIAACFAAVLIWAALLRPGLLVTREHLLMRSMVHTDRIPLAAIERVAVGAVFAVFVGGHRYVSPTVGYSARETVRQRRSGTTPTATDSYPVFVEERLTHLAKESRERRGITPGSPEQAELASGVRRTPAWPEIAGLVVTAVAFVVWLLVH